MIRRNESHSGRAPTNAPPPPPPAAHPPAPPRRRNPYGRTGEIDKCGLCHRPAVWTVAKLETGTVWASCAKCVRALVASLNIAPLDEFDEFDDE